MNLPVQQTTSLTARQGEILEYIELCQERTGVVPSTREIQEHFGFASQTAAMNHLKALEKKGAIVRQPGKARALVLASHLKRSPIVDVPVIGQSPSSGHEPQEDQGGATLSVDMDSAGLRKNSQMFAFRVKGDSMVGAQITEGDLVVLEQRNPRNGDVVAALIDGDTVLKRYVVPTDGTPYLKAENPKYPEIHHVTDLTIQGVMAALIRKCRSGSNP